VKGESKNKNKNLNQPWGSNDVFWSDNPKFSSIMSHSIERQT
jgi:hypothetical protein